MDLIAIVLVHRRCIEMSNGSIRSAGLNENGARTCCWVSAELAPDIWGDKLEPITTRNNRQTLN